MNLGGSGVNGAVPQRVGACSAGRFGACHHKVPVVGTNTPMPYQYRYPRPSVTVDPVIFGFDLNEADLQILLVQRADEPFRGRWALPGGFVMVSKRGEGETKAVVDGEAEPSDQGESLDAAVRRELKEETGITVAHLEQLYTFGAPGRDPRGRVISVAYMALVRRDQHVPTAGSDAAAARWFSVNEAPQMAFDHATIVARALERIRGKVRYAPIGFNLLPERFTMGELQRLYEALLLRPFDASNFAKAVQKSLILTDVIVKTRSVRKGPHRPAPLYRFDEKGYHKAVRDGRFDFNIRL